MISQIAYASSSQHTTTGNIIFSGTITKASCTISNAGTYQVNFGKVPTVYFGNKKGIVASERNMNIILENCDLYGFNSDVTGTETTSYKALSVKFSDTTPSDNIGFVAVKYRDSVSNQVGIEMYTNPNDTGYKKVEIRGTEPVEIDDILIDADKQIKTFTIPMKVKLSNMTDDIVTETGMFSAAVNMEVEYK